MGPGPSVLRAGAVSGRYIGPELRHYYRTAEDFRRYRPDHPERLAEIERLYLRYRRYFGHRILDLACGGGVLGAVLAGTGAAYVGVDANPDMTRSARQFARSSGRCLRFVKSDIARIRLTGRFDTLTLLGNALGHLDLGRREAALDRCESHLVPGARFLIEYRDVVGMFWNRTRRRGPYVERHKRGPVVHRTRSVDLEEGEIRIRARPTSGGWSVDFTHAIWSPFILAAAMRRHRWELLRRDPAPRPAVRGRLPEAWIDVYRK